MFFGQEMTDNQFGSPGPVQTLHGEWAIHANPRFSIEIQQTKRVGYFFRGD